MLIGELGHAVNVFTRFDPASDLQIQIHNDTLRVHKCQCPMCFYDITITYTPNDIQFLSAPEIITSVPVQVPRQN